VLVIRGSHNYFYRVFHKDLTDVKLPLTYDPNATRKCYSFLMTRTSVWASGTNPWPPRSLDLNALDFFFWGYVKERDYIPPLPRTVKEVKKCISEIIPSPNGVVLRRTWQDYESRLDACRVPRGAHMENLYLLICHLQHLK